MLSNTPILRQMYSTFCGNLLTISYGATIGWSVVNFVDLQKDNTKLPSGPLSLIQATRVMSLFFASAVVGNLLFPYIVKKIGCKKTMFVLGFPQMISWLLIMYAQNPYFLYASRILAGLVSAGLMVCLPLFITDICSDEIRGTLISLYDPFMNVGVLIALFLGKYFNYANQAMYLMISTTVFLILFAGIPESPTYLVNMEKQKAANKALEFFKGIEIENPPVAEEGKKLGDDTKLTLQDFKNHRARKAAFISFSLVLLNMLQGYVILQTYITDIVENSNPNISPIDASIIIVGMLIIANLVYVNLIDRAGRRVFYIFSSFATFVGHVLFALYLEFLAKNHEFDWVPIVCLSYVVFVTFLGLNPVPWLIMVEIFPKKIRNYGFSTCVLLALILQFILTEMYPPIQECVGLIGWIIFFAAACLGNAIFGIFYVPETKGKSHEEIMQMLD